MATTPTRVLLPSPRLRGEGGEHLQDASRVRGEWAAHSSPAPHPTSFASLMRSTSPRKRGEVKNELAGRGKEEREVAR